MSPMAPLTSWRLHQEGKSSDQEGRGQLLGVLPAFPGEGNSLRMNMVAFSLLGKRAFFVTQGPGTIMFLLLFLSP